MVKNKWLWLGIAAISLVGTAYYLQPQTWQPVSVNLATKLLQENGYGLLQVKDSTKLKAQIQTLEVKPDRWQSLRLAQSPPLTIYAFNSDRLCGAGGCLYSIYRQDTQQLLFKLLLNPHDSQFPPIFSRDRNCLTVKQATPERLAQINYCYIGERYVQNPIAYSANTH
jgi:hypothetical protein